MPKNKNQHWIPQFYLRNFSPDGIHSYCYLLKKKTSYWCKISNICSADYFYGKNQVAIELEKILSGLERVHARILQKITDERSLEIISEERNKLSLCMFLLLTNKRNTTAKKEILDIANHLFDIMKPSIVEIKEFKEMDITREDLDNFRIGRDAPNFEAMWVAMSYPWSIFDLKPILLINKTKRSFVTSDSPVVFYNYLDSYIELNDISLDGYISQGLVLFLPLSEKITLCLFDQKIYRPNVNTPTSNINLTNKRDVNALNRLQLLNADDILIHSKLEYSDDISSVHDDKLEGLRAKGVSIEKTEWINGNVLHELLRLYRPKADNIHRFSFFEVNEPYIMRLLEKVDADRRRGKWPNLFRDDGIADYILSEIEQRSYRIE